MMAGNEAECYSTQLIDGDGTFNGDGLDRFIKQVKLVECGLSYAVVAIMGPQSSGKSTLINHLFGTNFKEMDTDARRSQTTKGIWIARYVGIEPCTIVMDLEGTDGRERGEDDTAFEKQSTLFAIVVSDIVLINIWCHDIGREHAANKPLLRTVFRVMLQLFSSFKKTLMFVIRDKTRTLLKHLEDDLREDVEKIWDSVPKPKAHKHTRMRDLFNVEVVALSNYEENEEQFKEQVVKLRQKFFQSIAPGGLAGDRREVVPASGFSLSAQRIWKRIKENKDLDLPAHRVMVATLRCDAIVTEKYSTFFANKDWLDLQKAVETHPVEDFGKKLSSMISNCLSSYDREATYFEASVTSAKRKQLEGKLLQLVQPAYQLTLKHIRDLLLEKFKKEFSVSLNGGQGFAVVACDYTNKFMRLFDEQCERAVVKQANWNLDKIRDKFSRNLNSHITEVRIVELSKLTTMHESNLNEALYLPVKGHLEIGCDRTWPAIRELLQRETETAVSEFSSTLLTFDMDKQNKEDMISKLKNHARGLVEQTAREEAGNALHHMKERFTSIFNYDDDHMPRAWAGERNIPNIAKIARTASLKLLSVLAAIRLDDTTDTIWNTLVQTLLERTEDVTTSHDLLSSRTWKEVSATETLIAPSHCNSLWSQFQKETQYAIDQATNELLAAKKRKKELLLLAMNVALIGMRVMGVGAVLANLL